VRPLRGHGPGARGRPAGRLVAGHVGPGVDRLCATCTRDNVRSIEAKLDEEWW